MPITMDIDEERPVGEKSISKSEARIRALDVNRRQFLDPATNQRTKYLGTGTEPLLPPRSPVSVEANPDVLFSRKFGEITEMQEIFDEGFGKIRNPNKFSPTALKNQINSNIWEIIKRGTSQAAVRVRSALGKLGFENVKGQGYVMKAKYATAPSAGTPPEVALQQEVKPPTEPVVKPPVEPVVKPEVELKFDSTFESGSTGGGARTQDPAPGGWGLALIVTIETVKHIASYWWSIEKEDPMAGIPGIGAGRGTGATTLGLKGGWRNLVCHPGMPQCGR